MPTRPVLAVMALLAIVASLAGAQDAGSAALQPARSHQTILGWGESMPHASAPPMLHAQVIDRAVDDFGLNRLRSECPCGKRGRTATPALWSGAHEASRRRQGPPGIATGAPWPQGARGRRKRLTCGSRHDEVQTVDLKTAPGPLAEQL